MASGPDEQHWVRRAQAGDRAAFSELVRRYRGPLYAFCYRLTQSADAAADLAQDTFVRAWQYLGRFDPTRPFRPWLYAIAANRDSSRRRREEVRETVPLEELTVEPATPEDAATELERRQLRAAVRRAIAELSPQQRQAIVLVELEGLTAVDAAAILRCSPATVRQHVFRGKKRLRQLLSDFVQAGGEREETT